MGDNVSPEHGKRLPGKTFGAADTCSYDDCLDRTAEATEKSHQEATAMANTIGDPQDSKNSHHSKATKRQPERVQLARRVSVSETQINGQDNHSRSSVLGPAVLIARCRNKSYKASAKASTS